MFSFSTIVILKCGSDAMYSICNPLHKPIFDMFMKVNLQIPMQEGDASQFSKSKFSFFCKVRLLGL